MRLATPQFGSRLHFPPAERDARPVSRPPTPGGARTPFLPRSAVSCALAQLKRGRSAFPSQRPRNLSLSHIPPCETQPRVPLDIFGRPRRLQAAPGLFDSRKPVDHRSHCVALRGRPAVEVNQ